MRYTMTYAPLDFEARAYRPRDFTEAQLLLAALFGEALAAYGRSTATARRASLSMLEPSLLRKEDPFCTNGLLDLELESDKETIVGVAWIEVNDLGHLVYSHTFHAPSADSQHGWTEPTDFLGTTDLPRTLRDWLS